MRVDRLQGGIKWTRALVLIGLLAATGATAQTVTFDAMLIHASDQPAALDTRLDRIEYKLRRIFQFEHYAFLEETQTILTLPAETRIDLGHGYTLRINAEPKGDRIRADIQWYRGDNRLLRTSVAQRRGVPSILGGPAHKDGTLILVLEFR